MPTPSYETAEEHTSVGALISAAIIGAIIVLALFGHEAARGADVRLRDAHSIEWSAPAGNDAVTSGAMPGQGVPDPTIVPAGAPAR